MYGKIFESMYDGSLYGQWEALVTFQQMIVLADKEGFVDITPPALSARTGIPKKIIEKGIAILESDDPYSRTRGENGKRLVLISPDRPWGWKIVNYEKYRDMASQEDRRKYMKEYMQKRRFKEKEETPTAYCVYCGKEGTHKDHIIPQCFNGDDSNENIVDCCKSCNSSKGDHELIHWLINKEKITCDPNLKIALKNKYIKEYVVGYVNNKVNPLTLVNLCKSELAVLTHTDVDTDVKKKKGIIYSEDFEIFYKLYPNKKEKKAAFVRWNTLKKSGELPSLEILLTGIKKQIDWRKSPGDEFIPEWKHPAVWLNKGCWEDEIYTKPEPVKQYVGY